jgi:hypothetical protein
MSTGISSTDLEPEEQVEVLVHFLDKKSRIYKIPEKLGPFEQDTHHLD